MKTLSLAGRRLETQLLHYDGDGLARLHLRLA